LKYTLYAIFFLSIICFDTAVKTYEMHSNETVELLSEKKSEKEVEDIDEMDKLLCLHQSDKTKKPNLLDCFFTLFILLEQIVLFQSIYSR